MFKFSSKKGETVAILDIGSSSVGGALAVFRPGGEMCILYNTRKQIDIPAKYDIDEVFALLLGALSQVLSDLLNHSESEIDSFYCSLASPWYAATIQTISIKQEKDMNVTPHVIDMLIESEIKSFKSLVRSQDSREGKLEVVDAHTIQMKLNGYETSNPYNKVAKEIEAVLFLSLARQNILNAITISITKLFSRPNVIFNAFPVAAFSVTRDIFSDAHDFLLVDITGEVTDISLVKQNAIRKIASFPHGKNFFVRHVAKTLRTTPQEALSLFSLEKEKSATLPASGSFDEAITEASNEWTRYFLETLQVFSEHLSVPSRVFFIAHLDLAPFIERAIQKSNPSGVMLVGPAFKVQFLKEDIFDVFCTTPRQIKKDPFLSMEALFFQKLLEGEKGKPSSEEYYGRFTH